MEPIESRGDHVLWRVRVQPRASRNALRFEPGGRWRIQLTAPPVENAANKALCRYVSECLNLARADVALETGEKGRDKVLRIAGLTPEELRRRLSEAAGKG